MNWLTITSSMIASACATLSVIYFWVWRSNRDSAHLLFSITAASTAVFAFCELWVMRSQTPAELLAALRWSHVPLFFWLVSITWFVRTYLGAGRLWLAWTITGLRALSLAGNLLLGQSIDFRAITALRKVQFLGEQVTVIAGQPNSLTPVTQFATLLVLVFIADASITTWRRGDRRVALMVGGSLELLLIAGLGSAAAIIWLNAQLPMVFSYFYMGVVATMGLELSRDVVRASQLSRDLKASNVQISELFGRLIAAQETERARIARNLHDDFSQQIAALAIQISSMKRRADHAPPKDELVSSLNSLQQKTVSLADGIRQLSHELHPGLLQHTGLAAALRASCAEFQAAHSITVSCDASTGVGDRDPAVALCLYRVAQEALRNVVKHAEARHVTVVLSRADESIKLTITDDGKGFDLAASRTRATGLGLVSIDERVRMVGGTVHIATRDGGGTVVTVDIPCGFDSMASVP